MSEHSHDNKPGELEESRLVVDNDFGLSLFGVGEWIGGVVVLVG